MYICIHVYTHTQTHTDTHTSVYAYVGKLVTCQAPGSVFCFQRQPGQDRVWVYLRHQEWRCEIEIVSRRGQVADPDHVNVIIM